MIRCLGVEQWHTELQSVAFAMRATVHSSLGVTPASMVYGLDMVVPNYNLNKKNNNEHNDKKRSSDLFRANKKRIAVNYKVDDYVLVRRSPNELHSKWDSPQEGLFKIMEVHPNNTISILQHGLLQRINLRRVIPWKGRVSRSNDTEHVDDHDDQGEDN